VCSMGVATYGAGHVGRGRGEATTAMAIRVTVKRVEVWNIIFIRFSSFNSLGDRRCFIEVGYARSETPLMPSDKQSLIQSEISWTLS
jgi:hypothetical protein